LLAEEKGAVATLQFTRMLREAESPVCRAFNDVEGLSMWLNEVLTPREELAWHSFHARHSVWSCHCILPWS
jgi:hypothetical protein